MGFYFRKSIGFGPLRLNFSKSGIGVSAGVKGARISTGPRGTYVHAGRHGFYYNQRIGSQRVPPQNTQPREWVEEQAALPPKTFVVETADVSQLTETSITELLNQINEKAAEPRFAPWVIAITVVFAFVSGLAAWAVSIKLVELGDVDQKSAQGVASLVTLIVIVGIGGFGSFLAWRVHKGDELKRTTPLFYELEQDVSSKFEKVQNACSTLSRSQRIWRVHTNQPTWDWKRNAGAANLITRQPVFVGLMRPPYIATNVDVWGLRLNNLDMFFLPDYIFVRQDNRYGAVSYESLRLSSFTTRFIEDAWVPPDSQIVDYTWQFVNKKGGPDRRFSNNRQLPIAQYAFVQLQSNTGLNIHLHVSNIAAANAFSEYFGQTKATGRPDQYSNPRRNQHSDVFIDAKIRLAYAALGVPVSASTDQIISAYRNMAKMYHPDRLANLAPEFIELAESRMKEINAAYELLKRRKT